MKASKQAKRIAEACSQRCEEFWREAVDEGYSFSRATDQAEAVIAAEIQKGIGPLVEAAREAASEIIRLRKILPHCEGDRNEVD